MKTVAIGKLVPGNQYQVDGRALWFKGTRFVRSEKFDAKPVRFASAMNGDRWVFADTDGNEVVLKKGYDPQGNPGLIPESDDQPREKTVKIVA